MNLKYIFLFVLLFVFIRTSNSIAQYQIELKNDTLVADNQYDFDIYIKSSSGELNITAYQIILTLNDSIASGANLSFKYIEHSSQLTNIPDLDIGVISDSGKQNLAVGSHPGSDTISSNDVRIGSFRISSSNPFKSYKPDIQWDFSGFVKSGINISNISMTVPSNYINLLTNPVLIFTGINEKKINPQKFELYQNYPNPFNPVTDIKFSIPEQGRVVLTIYNILGEKVAVLVNHVLNEGTYTIKFDGDKMASGIYIYRLQINNFIQSRKMVLLK